METERLTKLPTSSELFVLYCHLLSIPNGKKATKKTKNNEECIGIRQNNAVSDFTSYGALAKKIGVNWKEKTLSELLQNANPEFNSLFEFEELHHKIVQSILIVGDYKKIDKSKHELLKSIYAELFSLLDYFEKELRKLNSFYIFQPKQNNESILDELVEKFFIPQISTCLLYIKQGTFKLNNTDDDYYILKYFDDVIKIIISYHFNITKAFKHVVSVFISKTLKMTKISTHFTEEFRNINDKDFPSFNRVKNWIDKIIASNEHFDVSIFNKIIAQHKLFYLMIKIKKMMGKSLKKYKFNHLILDFHYYCNPRILKIGHKIKPSLVDGYYDRFPCSSYYSEKNFFARKTFFLDEHRKYCINNAQTSEIQNIKLICNPDEKIYYTLNFLKNDQLPSDLVDYLKYGLKTEDLSITTEKIIILLKKHTEVSLGLKVICLFTEAIHNLLNKKIELSKEKITEAFNCIDEYPIGTIFYQYILTFYIGICKIEKSTPYQFTQKISFLTNYSRFSLISLSMQKEFNILNRVKLPSNTYVEDVILIKSMSEFNRFCIAHKLKKDLLFNPFEQIEFFHSAIIDIMDTLSEKKNINSLSDILMYITTDHYKELCNYLPLKPSINLRPKVKLTQDSINDFYSCKTFYISLIKDLRLESELEHTMEILQLPFK